MNILKSKENVTPSLEKLKKEQAKRHNLSVSELNKMYEGKKCPKYGIKELLHMRKVKGGKLVVFNISEKHRGEKISIGRKNITHKKNKESESADTKKS